MRKKDVQRTTLPILKWNSKFSFCNYIMCMFRTLSIMENNTFSFLPHHPVTHTGSRQTQSLEVVRTQWIKQSTSFGVRQTGIDLDLPLTSGVLWVHQLSLTVLILKTQMITLHCKRALWLKRNSVCKRATSHARHMVSVANPWPANLNSLSSSS